MTRPQTPASEYGPTYYRGATESNYRDYALQERVTERYWLPVIERHRRVIGQRGPGRCLDVGCAYGFLVQAYRRLAWEAEGCDISEYAIQEGERRGIHGIRCGALDALDYPSASYDLVTCVDVIEHLDPVTYRAYIASFHRLLKPGGVLFVATPNGIDCSGFNVFSPDWAEGDRTHINYRSVRELTMDFAALERVIVHGATPFRGQFLSFRPFRWLPSKANGLIRWVLWRLLANDLQHSAYLLLIGCR